MNRGLLREEQIGSIERKVSVNLVGRHLMIALYARFSRGIHESRSAHNVRSEKHLGIFYRAVNMAFRREVDDYIELLILEQLVNKLAVCDIALYELEMLVFHRLVEGLEIAGISQKVEADDVIIRMLAEHMIDKVAADKTGASRNENLHVFVLHIK